jgi:Fur family peroxide stress response transcriptional regulator
MVEFWTNESSFAAKRCCGSAKPTRLVTRFRERGHRLTPQRIALLRLIAASEGHPSAFGLYEQIKEQFPTTSLATVYKTLAVLKDMGEVLELGFSDDDNRYDGNRPYPVIGHTV